MVTTEDYVKWSYCLVGNNVSSPSLHIIAYFSFSENVIEVEDYFNRTLKELKIQESFSADPIMIQSVWL
jgi:hypothetical protein